MKKMALKIAVSLALAAALCGCMEPDPQQQQSPPPPPKTIKAPSNLRVEYTFDAATISWDITDNVSYYRVYCSDSPEGPYEEVCDNNGYNSSYVYGSSSPKIQLNWLPKKIPYYYKVAAIMEVYDKLLPVSEIKSELSEYIIVTMPDLRQPPYVSVYLIPPDGAHVYWNTEYGEEIEGIKEYHVYRNSVLVGTVSEPLYEDMGYFAYEDTGLVIGGVYTYTVASVTDDGEGPQSPSYYGELKWPPVITVPEIPVLTIPPVIKEIKASSSGGSVGIRVSWDSLSGADSYKVYRSTDADDSYTLIQEGIYRTQYTDNKVEYNKFYYYKVSAINTNGESELSEYACIILYPAPKGIKAVLTKTGLPPIPNTECIKIDWDAYSNATEYRLYRSTDAKTYTLLKTLSENTYNDLTNGLAGSTTYFYKAAAVINGYESEQSSASAGVLTKPDAPDGVEISYLSLPLLFSTTITWKSVKGAQIYRVYRDGTWMFKTAYLSYTDVTALLAGRYEYYVTAVNDSGESLPSKKVYYNPR